ncbi:MAG: BamA/TamA family outer membrane protein [Vulcanimicrobiota bacterium]
MKKQLFSAIVITLILALVSPAFAIQASFGKTIFDNDNVFFIAQNETSPATEDSKPKEETEEKVKDNEQNKDVSKDAEVSSDEKQDKTDDAEKPSDETESSDKNADGSSRDETKDEDTVSRPGGIREEGPLGERERAVDRKNVRITAIEIRGNERVPTEKVMEVIRSKVGDLVLEPRIRSDIQAIYDMGYFTSVEFDTPYYAGGIKLVYRLQENPVVTKINILGNKMVSTEKLQDLMQTKTGNILNMKVLNADMSEINYYYNETLGYLLEPTHIKDVTWTPEGELILNIQEGMIITQINIEGSSLFEEEKLKSLVKTKSGMMFNTKEIKEDSEAITRFYEEKGYYLDTVRPQVNYRDGIVTIQIIEAVVEDIKVEFESPKHKTKDYVVLRNIRTKKGEVLQTRKLQRDVERLNNLGYFSKVTVEPEPGSKPGHMIFVFKLKEQKTGLATIGVGYAGGGSGALRSGITGALSFSERNLGGTGQSVSASWQRGVNVDALAGSYSNPAINQNQDSFSISLFRHNYSELRQPILGTQDKFALYDDKRYGGSVVYGRRVTDDFRLFFNYRKEHIDITRNPKSEYNPVGISAGVLNSAGLGALFDTRDDVFDPTDGVYIDADVTYGGKVLGGDYDYNKYQAELRKYFPIGKKRRSTIALRAWGGMIKGGTAPITETFYVGGADTIRGYLENEFYGTRMVVLNAEYRFPIANIKYLKGAVFADAGNAWTPGVSRSKIYKDAGVGLRIVFPTLGLGVIRLDYAVGERGGRTSIGIGQTF